MSKTNEEIDQDNRCLEKARKKVASLKTAAHYHDSKSACCLSCEHSDKDCIEDNLQCDLLSNYDWSVGDVNELAICDNFKWRNQ
jgi:hypothetical protein